MAAGMDDYLAKPLEAEELYGKIEKYTANSAVNVESRDSNAAASLNLDVGKLLARLDGDRELLKEIATMFIANSDEYLARVEEAIVDCDAEGLYSAAHSLKGAVSNFGAEALVEMSIELEKIAKNVMDPELAQEVLDRMKRETGVLSEGR